MDDLGLLLWAFGNDVRPHPAMVNLIEGEGMVEPPSLPSSSCTNRKHTTVREHMPSSHQRYAHEAIE